jgi:hypothetical protein
MAEDGARGEGQRMLRRSLLKIVLSLFITLALLEAASSVIWLGQDCISFSGKEICLLPRPILEDSQIADLDRLINDPQTYYQFDPVLGWSIRPNRSAEQEGAIYTSNSIGIRALRSYAPRPPAGITRIAAFGPSFTHADEVSDKAAWTYQMEQARPDLEVMNWGVAGYGTDQAFLRYKTQGAAYAPAIVLIGFEEENLRRNVNRFRPFYSGGTDFPLTKPVFVLDGTALQLLPNPFDSAAGLRDVVLYDPNRFLDMVCPVDYYCLRPRYQQFALDRLKSFRFLRTLIFEVQYSNEMRRYSSPLLESYKDPRQVDVSIGLFRLFIEEVRRNGAVPVVIAFPRQGTVERYAQGEQPYYRGGAAFFQDEGIYTLDLADSFVAASREQGVELSAFFARHGHYNEAGNRLVGQAVLGYLCQQKLLSECF